MDVLAILVPLVLSVLALYPAWPGKGATAFKARIVSVVVLNGLLFFVCWLVAAGFVGRVAADRAELAEFRSAGVSVPQVKADRAEVARFRAAVKRYNEAVAAYNADPRLAPFKKQPVFGE